MPNSHVIFSLAKVIIAAAWADGEVSLDEINSMKDLLFRLPDLTERDWKMLDMYIEAPVGDAERARLVTELKQELRSSQEKAAAKEALIELVRADGEVTEAEEAVLDEINHAMDNAGTRMFGGLGRLMKGSINRRSQTFSDAPNREIYFDDFVKNKIYYEVRRKENLGNLEIHIPEPILRKLSLAGGLMARVADVDREVTDGEYERMIAALQAGWELDRQIASIVAQVAVSEVGRDLDYYRLTRSFFDATTETERVRFLDVLFSVAQADGFVTNDEIEEIRSIAISLKLTHKQFIDAKVEIARENRAN